MVRHAILLLAHERPRQLQKLLEELKHERVEVFVHLDAKTSHLFPKLGVRTIAEYDIVWGGHTMVEATLGLMAEASKTYKYHTYTLISGVDWPVKTISEIVSVLDSLPASLVDYWHDEDPSWHSRYRRYFFNEWRSRKPLNALSRRLSAILPDRKPPVKVWFGSQWWTLQDVAVRTVLRFYEEYPEVRKWLRTIHIPDECAIQTALMNSDKMVPLERGHRRYLDWSRKRAHPEELTLDDVERIRDEDWLFARKVILPRL